MLICYWYLLVQNQQLKHQNNVCNLFKVNNKDILRRSGVFIVNFEQIFHTGVSIVEFEQVNAGWD